MKYRIFLAFTALFLAPATPANAAQLLMTSRNLEDFSFTTRPGSGGDCWTIHMQVSGADYTFSSCDDTSSDLWAALKRVMRSPYAESCVLREWCDRSGCTKIYGRQTVEARLKLIHNLRRQVQRFFDLSTSSKCE